MSGFRLWRSRFMVGLFGLPSLLLCAGFVYQQAGRTRESNRLPKRIGRAINIGERSPEPVLLRRGDPPSVILEAGGSSSGSRSNGLIS